MKYFTYLYCFFADDGLLLTKSINEMRSLIELIEVAARKIGLEINRGKSVSMIFNMKDKPNAISGISVKNEICLLYTSPSPRDKRQSRMPSSA